jgi:hypothetical protein
MNNLLVYHSGYNPKHMKRYTDLTPKNPFKDTIEWLYVQLTISTKNDPVNPQCSLIQNKSPYLHTFPLRKALFSSGCIDYPIKIPP